MIKANELRISNWFLCNLFSADEYYQVETIEREGVKYGSQDSYVIPYSYVEPISLTPEILEKVGFKIKQKQGFATEWHHCDGDFEIDEVTNMYQEGVKLEGYAVFASEWTIGTPFQYLHQLQNVFFALTGEELPVNLNLPLNSI
jgi:hypothetical protein